MTSKIMDLLSWCIGMAGLVAAAVIGAVLVLFTAPVFAWLDYHPIALDFVGGGIGRAELLIFRWDGQGFTADEIAHLTDVKAMLGTLAWCLAGAVLVLTLLWAFNRQVFRSICLWAPGIFVAVGGSIVAAYLVFGFSRVGIFLHQTVFPQGNWSFPFSSLIIRLYGTEEMIAGTVFVILSALAVLVLVALGSFVISHRGIKSGK